MALPQAGPILVWGMFEAEVLRSVLVRNVYPDRFAKIVISFGHHTGMRILTRIKSNTKPWTPYPLRSTIPTISTSIIVIQVSIELPERRGRLI